MEDFPFLIKRFYLVHGQGKRAGHRHKRTHQLIICIFGTCILEVNNGKEKTMYTLDKSDKALYLLPEDWHIMTGNYTILVLASQPYDVNDYIDEPYGR